MQCQQYISALDKYSLACVLSWLTTEDIEKMCSTGAHWFDHHVSTAAANLAFECKVPMSYFSRSRGNVCRMARRFKQLKHLRVYADEGKLPKESLEYASTIRPTINLRFDDLNKLVSLIAPDCELNLEGVTVEQLRHLQHLSTCLVLNASEELAAHLGRQIVKLGTTVTCVSKPFSKVVWTSLTDLSLILSMVYFTLNDTNRVRLPDCVSKNFPAARRVTLISGGAMPNELNLVDMPHLEQLSIDSGYVCRSYAYDPNSKQHYNSSTVTHEPDWIGMNDVTLPPSVRQVVIIGPPGRGVAIHNTLSTTTVGRCVKGTMWSLSMYMPFIAKLSACPSMEKISIPHCASIRLEVLNQAGLLSLDGPLNSITSNDDGWIKVSDYGGLGDDGGVCVEGHNAASMNQWQHVDAQAPNGSAWRRLKSIKACIADTDTLQSELTSLSFVKTLSTIVLHLTATLWHSTSGDTATKLNLSSLCNLLRLEVLCSNITVLSPLVVSDGILLPDQLEQLEIGTTPEAGAWSLWKACPMKRERRPDYRSEHDLLLDCTILSHLPRSLTRLKLVHGDFYASRNPNCRFPPYLLSTDAFGFCHVITLSNELLADSSNDYHSPLLSDQIREKSISPSSFEIIDQPESRVYSSSQLAFIESVCDADEDVGLRLLQAIPRDHLLEAIANFRIEPSVKSKDAWLTLRQFMHEHHVCACNSGLLCGMQ